MIESDAVDLVMVLTAMQRARRDRQGRAARRQARARREADGDHDGGGGRAARGRARRARPARVRSAHRPLPDLRRDLPPRPARGRRPRAAGAGALRLGRSVVGLVVLPPGRRRAVRPRRLQRHRAHGADRARAAGDGDGRHGHARARGRRRARCAPRSVDNAHVLLDFGDAVYAVGDHRLQHAEVQRPRDRDLRLRRARSR